MSEQTQAEAGNAKAHGNAISFAELAIALAAFIGASCCALPLVLASLGLAGAWIANLEVFVVYRTYVAVAAVVIILIGWGVALRRHASPGTYVVLGLATVTVAAAMAISQYEGEITRYLVSMRRK